MKGDDKIRFCSHCAFEVNDISALSRKQAMHLVRSSEGRICVRYVKNPADGKIRFAGKLYQITRRAGLAAGVLGASLTLSTMAYAQSTNDNQENTDRAETRIEVSDEKQSEEEKPAGAATLSGIVTDPKGAVIPYAGLTLTDEATNASFIIQTDENGAYQYESLAAGKYKLSVVGGEAFAEKEIAGIEITEGNKIKRDVALELSGSTFIVNVDEKNVTNFVTMGVILSVRYTNPITAAVSENNIEEVRNLIARGVGVNRKDENYDNITPLFVAVENGNLEITELLLSFRARANALSSDRQTPLMSLDEDASAELVRVLFKYGAKVNLADNEGNTALILAAGSVKTEVLQILLDHGADVNARNKQGQTALMSAAEADNLENVRALILAGADLNLKDKDGETALDLTTSAEVEQLLKNYGANVEAP